MGVAKGRPYDLQTAKPMNNQYTTCMNEEWGSTPYVFKLIYIPQLVKSVDGRV